MRVCCCSPLLAAALMSSWHCFSFPISFYECPLMLFLSLLLSSGRPQSGLPSVHFNSEWPVTRLLSYCSWGNLRFPSQSCCTFPNPMTGIWWQLPDTGRLWAARSCRRALLSAPEWNPWHCCTIPGCTHSEPRRIWLYPLRVCFRTIGRFPPRICWPSHGTTAADRECSLRVRQYSLIFPPSIKPTVHSFY